MNVYRWALVLGAIVVVLGTLGAVVEVADGIVNGKVDYRGKLNAQRIVLQLNADESPVETRDWPRLTSAEGVVTDPSPSVGEFIAWAVGTLAPWGLVIACAWQLWPVLRRADRGDPFWDDAPLRFATVGWLLLVAIPLIAVYQGIVADRLNHLGLFLEPAVAAGITISLWHFLPGVAVLVLAAVFKRGAELRDFEQHAI